MVKMCNRFGCNLALTGALLLSVPAAHAVSKIVISGNIKAAPCEIDGANGTVSVNLGDDISAATLATSGAFSPWIEFPLTLKKLPKHHHLCRRDLQRDARRGKRQLVQEQRRLSSGAN